MCEAQVMAVRRLTIDSIGVQANLAQKDDAVTGLQTAFDEQQGTVHALRKELEEAQALATELAATSQQEQNELTASLATSTSRMVHCFVAQLFQYQEV